MCFMKAIQEDQSLIKQQKGYTIKADVSLD